MHEARSQQGQQPWSEIFFVQAWEFVCTYRTCVLRQVCDRSLLLRGPLPARQTLLLQSCPALILLLAGECPLHARAIVIF